MRPRVIYSFTTPHLLVKPLGILQIDLFRSKIIRFIQPPMFRNPFLKQNHPQSSEICGTASIFKDRLLYV